MIAYLKGIIIDFGKNFAIIETGGIGYKVFLSKNQLLEIAVGQEAVFFIYQHTTDQGSSLFGLRNTRELEFFELLLGVSGIGPKTAIQVFDHDMNDIIKSIILGKPELVSKTTGLGKKTAERVVLELSKKISQFGLLPSSEHNQRLANDYNEEIEALAALGYGVNQAIEALSQVDPAIKDTGERIRQALRKIK